MKLSEEMKRIRSASGMAMKAFGDKLGVSKSYIAQIEYGETSTISFEFAAKVCAAYGLPMDHFIPFLAPGVTVPPPPSSLHSLDVLGTVAAGVMDVPEVFTERITIQVSEHYPNGTFGLKVAGRSCEKWGIHNGDIVIVVPRTDLIEGEFFVIGSADGHTLKAYRNKKLWQFRPEDAEPVEFKLDGSCRVVGIVVLTYGPRKFLSNDAKPKKKR